MRVKVYLTAKGVKHFKSCGHAQVLGKKAPYLLFSTPAQAIAASVREGPEYFKSVAFETDSFSLHEVRALMMAINAGLLPFWIFGAPPLEWPGTVDSDAPGRATDEESLPLADDHSLPHPSVAGSLREQTDPHFEFVDRLPTDQGTLAGTGYCEEL